jgi:hypothetical protein
MDWNNEQTLNKQCTESAAIYLHLAILMVRSGRCLQNHFWWALHGACSTFSNNKTKQQLVGKLVEHKLQL